MIRTSNLPENGTVHRPSSGRFRLVVIASSILLFAATFGWLACIRRDGVGEVTFQWQWQAAVWIAVGIASPVYFWQQIWPVQPNPSVSPRRRAIKGWTALLLPSLMWMAYPLRFISGQQLLNVGIGLAIAGIVLTFGGWMVFQLIKGFDDGKSPPPEK